jgi:NADH:ubiquinone oxidoreductase subunit H
MVFLLSLSGVLSLIERVLLAAVHFRQGPLLYGLHGIFLFVCDGIKLYSKFAVEITNGIGILLFISVCCCLSFVVCVISIDFGVISWVCREFEIILGFVLIGISTLGTILPAAVSRSRYVMIGSIRAMKAVLFSDIVSDTALVIYLLHSKALVSGTITLVLTYGFIIATKDVLHIKIDNWIRKLYNIK